MVKTADARWSLKRKWVEESQKDLYTCLQYVHTSKSFVAWLTDQRTKD